MRNCTLIVIGILLLSATPIFGQNPPDSITVKKTLGTVFIQNGIKLKPNQLLKVTEINTDAYKEMKIAKTNYTIGSIFGFSGGFLVGYPLGAAIAGGELNWTLAGIGAGLIVASIPFSISYTKHAKNAVKIYNNGLEQAGLNTVDFKVNLTSTGVGIHMTF